jgi:hypothetical protein
MRSRFISSGTTGVRSHQAHKLTARNGGWSHVIPMGLADLVELIDAREVELVQDKRRSMVQAAE